MGFRKTTATFVIVLSWIAADRAAAQSDGIAEITVTVLNGARISQPLIKRAEGEAGRIFRAAGIHVRWVDCFKGGDCHHPPGPREFVLNIVSDGRTSNELVYGLAFLGPAGEGKYSDVFFRRIEEAAALNGADLARFLGTVAAHELGHLLLGSHAHTYEGVMSAVWREPTLRRMQMGSLLFTTEESALIKARIDSQDGPRQRPGYAAIRPRPLVP